MTFLLETKRYYYNSNAKPNFQHLDALINVLNELHVHVYKMLSCTDSEILFLNTFDESYWKPHSFRQYNKEASIK